MVLLVKSYVICFRHVYTQIMIAKAQDTNNPYILVRNVAPRLQRKNPDRIDLDLMRSVMLTVVGSLLPTSAHTCVQMLGTIYLGGWLSVITCQLYYKHWLSVMVPSWGFLSRCFFLTHILLGEASPGALVSLSRSWYRRLIFCRLATCSVRLNCM